MMKRGMQPNLYEAMMRNLPLGIDQELGELYIKFLSKQADTVENKKILGCLNIEIDVFDRSLERFAS
jgi:hypothetical protein